MAATKRPVNVNVAKGSFYADAAITGTTDLPVLVYLTASSRLGVTTIPTSSASSTYNALGTVDTAVAAGETVPVNLIAGSSIIVMTAGETIAAGEYVCPSEATAGYVDDADTTSDIIIGIALTGGDAGELISVTPIKNGVLAL